MLDSKHSQFEDAELKMPEENFMAADAPAKTVSWFTVLLVIIVVLLLGVLGGLLWWGSLLLKPQTAPEVVPTATRPTPEENNEPESTTAEAEVETLQALSSSDATNDMLADLEATKLEGLTREFQIIDNLLEEVRQ